MRGNETANPSGTDGDALKFPIPMRGNEVVEAGRADWIERPFPIPMRGNEKSGTLQERLAWEEVSDPHEG